MKNILTFFVQKVNIPCLNPPFTREKARVI